MQDLSTEERRNDIYKNTFQNPKCKRVFLLRSSSFIRMQLLHFEFAGVFFFLGAAVASIGIIFSSLLILAAIKVRCLCRRGCIETLN